MIMTYLAHGGQMTGDEIAIMGGGLSFALLFPVVLLVIVAKTRKPSLDVANTQSATRPAASNTPTDSSGLAVLRPASSTVGQHLSREES